MDDGWCDTWTYGSRSICAMKDQIRHLRHREREQCEIIRQLTDQLQERNKPKSTRTKAGRSETSSTSIGRAFGTRTSRETNPLL